MAAGAPPTLAPPAPTTGATAFTDLPGDLLGEIMRHVADADVEDCCSLLLACKAVSQAAGVRALLPYVRSRLVRALGLHVFFIADGDSLSPDTLTPLAQLAACSSRCIKKIHFSSDDCASWCLLVMLEDCAEEYRYKYIFGLASGMEMEEEEKEENDEQDDSWSEDPERKRCTLEERCAALKEGVLARLSCAEHVFLETTGDYDFSWIAGEDYLADKELSTLAEKLAPALAATFPRLRALTLITPHDNEGVSALLAQLAATGVQLHELHMPRLDLTEEGGEGVVECIQKMSGGGGGRLARLTLLCPHPGMCPALGAITSFVVEQLPDASFSDSIDFD